MISLKIDSAKYFDGYNSNANLFPKAFINISKNNIYNSNKTPLLLIFNY